MASWWCWANARLPQRGLSGRNGLRLSEGSGRVSGMAHVEAAIQGSSSAKRSKPPRHPIDRRTRLGRRVTELRRLYLTRLGSDDAVVVAAAGRAAALTAMAEDLSARWLRGHPISPDDVVRAHRLSDLHLRRLKLDRHVPRDATPSLEQYLQQKAEGHDDDDRDRSSVG